jgi:hypothetical protein
VSTPAFRSMSEAKLLECVLDLARLYGWRSFHARPAMTARGYRTPVQGDGKGFPDLILLKPPKTLAVELKATGKNPTEAQRIWLEKFYQASAGGLTWRPADWHSGEILRVLSA